MIYLGKDAVGLNQLLAKNIPLKWDIIEYTPLTNARENTIYHNLGFEPDICLIIPDYFDNQTGQTNPMLLFCTNSKTDGYNRVVDNYLTSTYTWDYTANPNNGNGLYYVKDNEKITIYAGSNSLPMLHQNEKYYALFIKFNS